MSSVETPAERQAGMKQLQADVDRKAIRDFDAAVEVKQAGGTVTRRAAATAVAKAQPSLHKAYVKACNPGRGQRAALGD